MHTAQEAVEIVNRRRAYLRSHGEHLRNTVAWRDSRDEARQLFCHLYDSHPDLAKCIDW